MFTQKFIKLSTGVDELHELSCPRGKNRGDSKNNVFASAGSNKNDGILICVSGGITGILRAME